MTELQIGLIGLGGVVVVGVVAYNTWQEYKFQKLAERVLDDRHPDVLLDGGAREESDTAEAARKAPREPSPTRFPANALQVAGEDRCVPVPGERIEPVFHFSGEAPAATDEAMYEIAPEAMPEAAPEMHVGTALAHQVSPAATPEQPAPRVGLRATSAAAPAAQYSAAPMSTVAPAPAQTALSRSADEAARESRESGEPLHLLSPVIDYVAVFEAVEPASAAQVLEAQRDALALVGKPIYSIGYNERSREWESIVSDGVSEYRRIRIGLQLVDRRGPVGETALATFHDAMHDLADELMAVAELPSRQAALSAAATLDEFCASVDIQIGINVVSGGQIFLGTKLRALAEAAGMVITSDGRFVRCDDDGNVLYVLVNQDDAGFSVESMKTMSTHGVTFLLDVPRVAHGERVFNQMVDLARRFAEVLHGSLVDDNRRPLSEGALEPIRRQVGQYQAAMAAHNLPAGGDLAQRIFS